MMLQSLADLDRPQVAYDAIMAIAHSRQMAILKRFVSRGTGQRSREFPMQRCGSTFFLLSTARAQHNRFITTHTRRVDDKAVKLYLSSRIDDGFFRQAV